MPCTVLLLQFCLSIHLSHACCENGIIVCQYLNTIRNRDMISLVFPLQLGLLEMSHSTLNICRKWPTPSKNADFGRFLFFRYLWPWAFQRATDGVHTLPISPQRVAQKAISIFFIFWIKITWIVCCKVSLCENFQRQTCSTTIPVANGPDISTNSNPST